MFHVKHSNTSTSTTIITKTKLNQTKTSLKEQSLRDALIYLVKLNMVN